MSFTKSIKKALSKDTFKFLTNTINPSFEFMKDKKTFLSAFVTAQDATNLNDLNIINIQEGSPVVK